MSKQQQTNPNSLANLRPFQPGQSGNPGGTVRGVPKLKTALHKILRTPVGKRFVAATLSDRIAKKTYDLAMRGNTKMLELIWERIEGKVVQPVSLPDEEARIELAVQLLIVRSGLPPERARALVLEAATVNEGLENG